MCVILFSFLYKSTFFLITEHGGEGEAVELIVLGEEGNLKEQPRTEWKWNEATENWLWWEVLGETKVGLHKLIMCNGLRMVVRKVRI